MPTIADCMPRDRFFTLRTTLHVVDTNNIPRESEINRLWKVQPTINVVRSACLRPPRPSENDYSTDEQMVPFTGRCTLSQYFPNKPRPLGINNFVLATTKGLVLDFEFYQGKSTPLPDVGLSLGPSVILRLAQTLPQGSRLYFDRYFIALPLLQQLLDLGLEGTVTIMKNRVKPVHLTEEKRLNRGDMEEFCRDGDKTIIVQWKDSKAVTLASTCTGCEPVSKVERWSKPEKKYILVPYPAVIVKYNLCMGGVDLCDQMMETYRTFLKTKKWILKVLIHLLDLACVNSWLPYKVECEANKVQKKNTLDVLGLRQVLGEALISSSSGQEHESESVEEPPNKMYKPANTTCDEKRLDGYHHWPTVDDLP
ncbi:piggyBac transposable element-derived protein 3-like [Schistocerca americana]|uniref:piggyBac transposable element-derived protein 3-like n=1 Tax=Schistocerca americana TaxID=7009 RepID=UPI001F4FAEE8|nr:piggyBac transposable element-derived protein 3-like [Schistocerca americana]